MTGDYPYWSNPYPAMAGGNVCPACGFWAFYGISHTCVPRIPPSPLYVFPAPLTADEVRRIVREELARARAPDNGRGEHQ